MPARGWGLGSDEHFSGSAIGAFGQPLANDLHKLVGDNGNEQMTLGTAGCISMPIENEIVSR